MYQYTVYDSKNCPEDVFRFRYSVYIEELHRSHSYACHETATIKDGLDRTARHTVVTKNGAMIAYMRLNLLRDGDVQPYFHFYDLCRLTEGEQESAAVCTLDMIAKPYRRTFVFVRMIQTMYEHGIRNGVTKCFMDVNLPLVKLHEKLGFKLQNETIHPDHGPVAVMCLDSLDYEYLKGIRSPLAQICKKFLAEKSVRELA